MPHLDLDYTDLTKRNDMLRAIVSIIDPLTDPEIPTGDRPVPSVLATSYYHQRARVP